MFVITIECYYDQQRSEEKRGEKRSEGRRREGWDG